MAGLVVVPVLVLLSACKDDGASPFGLTGGGGSGGVGAEASTAPVTTTSGSPLGAQGSGGPTSGGLAQVGGVWTGTYYCNQGATSMTLALVPNGAALTGTFEFTAGSTTGAYTLKGEQDGSNVVLHADQWLKQPDGFFTVDFEITSISASRLAGKVDGDGCSTFSVSRSGG